MAGTREVRLVRLAARLNGDMRGLSSAKTGWRRSGAAARRPKVRLFGRVDAPLCGRPAKKQSRNEQHHAGDFGVRSCGDGALHLGPLTWAQRNLTCVAKRRDTAVPKSVDPPQPAQARLLC